MFSPRSGLFQPKQSPQDSIHITSVLDTQNKIIDILFVTSPFAYSLLGTNFQKGGNISAYALLGTNIYVDIFGGNIHTKNIHIHYLQQIITTQKQLSHQPIFHYYAQGTPRGGDSLYPFFFFGFFTFFYTILHTLQTLQTFIYWT